MSNEMYALRDARIKASAARNKERSDGIEQAARERKDSERLIASTLDDLSRNLIDLSEAAEQISSPIPPRYHGMICAKFPVPEKESDIISEAQTKTFHDLRYGDSMRHFASESDGTFAAKLSDIKEAGCDICLVQDETTKKYTVIVFFS